MLDNVAHMNQQGEQVPVYGIPTAAVPEVWPRVKPILDPAITEDSDLTPESVYHDIATGLYHLWVIGDYQAVAVTQIQNRPAGKVAWIQFIAGSDMKEWFDDWVAAVEHYAQFAGCKAVEFSGRRGWLRHAKKYTNYKPVWTIFRRVF